MNIPVILGTAREGRQSEKVANYVLQKAQDFGFASELIDPRDYPLEATKRKAYPEYGEKIDAADGYIIVVPEYNRGYPGELKMLLDSFYPEYARKPVGICGVSSGPTGGVRAVEQLKLVTITFQMVAIRESVYFGNIEELFDEKGNIQDKEYDKRVQKFLEEMSWYATALKQARSEG